MEVIKNNHVSSDKLIYVQCKHCNSVLKCTESELNLPCPCCGHSLKEDSLEKEDCKITICNNCGRTFEYDLDNCDIGEYGLYYIHCPHCDHYDCIEEEEGIELNIDNLREEHFADHSNGKPVDFSEIKRWIKIGITFLKSNPDQFVYFTMSGDSFIMIFREGDEFGVVYTNDYEDVYLNGGF